MNGAPRIRCKPEHDGFSGVPRRGKQAVRVASDAARELSSRACHHKRIGAVFCNAETQLALLVSAARYRVSMFWLLKTTFSYGSIALILIQHAYAGGYSAAERYAGERTAFGLQTTGCNASVFAQAPEDHSLFLGRQMITKDGENTCDGRAWKIVLDRLDWTTKTFEIVHPVITPPVEIEGGRRLLNAYDPDIVEFRGDYWLTFECVGDGIPGTTTCLAPMDKRSMTLEPENI